MKTRVSLKYFVNDCRRIRIFQGKRIHKYYPRTKKEKCESEHHQIVLLCDKEVEGRKLQWQGAELCQKMKVTTKFHSMIVTKLLL